MMFFARALFCGELEEGVIGVVAAELETGEGTCLELQLARDFDDQDRALGMDTYCVVLNGGACVYGGVESWRVTAGRLTIALSRRASDVLGTESSLSVDFDPGETPKLREWLAKVLTARPSGS